MSPEAEINLLGAKVVGAKVYETHPYRTPDAEFPAYFPGVGRLFRDGHAFSAYLTSTPNGVGEWSPLTRLDQAWEVAEKLMADNIDAEVFFGLTARPNGRAVASFTHCETGEWVEVSEDCLALMKAVKEALGSPLETGEER